MDAAARFASARREGVFRCQCVPGAACMPPTQSGLVPPLSDHVGRVLEGCSRKEMARLDARGVVAAVADKPCGGVIPNQDFIGEEMRPLEAIAEPEVAITIGVVRAHPQPATAIRFRCNLIPQAPGS